MRGGGDPEQVQEGEEFRFMTSVKIDVERSQSSIRLWYELVGVSYLVTVHSRHEEEDQGGRRNK